MLILPSEIEGLPVRRISDFAFGQNSVIESVVLPSSLRVIGKYAFWNCPNLISVRVEEGITSLPKSIFSNCTSLSEVDLPNGLLQIGEGAFYACSSLASLVLPSGLEEIGQDAFYACSSLTALSLPSSLKVIGSSAFDTTPWYEALSDEYVIVGRGILLKVNNKYSDDIVISEGVSSIYASMYTFKSSYVGSVTLPASLCSWNHSDMGLKATGFDVSSENPYLEAIDGVLYTKGGETLLAFPAYRTGSFTLPSGVKKIGDGAFQNSALSAISLGDQLLEIGELAFYFCREIRELQIPNSVTRVGKGAMSAMAGLSAVTLPNGLTELEGQLFFNCSSLTKVTLGGLVTKINASVFYGCPSSLVVCFDGSREAWGAIEVSGVGNDALASATIVCKGEEEPAPTLPDNLGAFREAVEAITVGSVGEAAYEELSGALILYGKLSADEKAAAGEEIAKLEAAISAYNAAVETVSGELDRASEIAVGSVSGSVTLLAVLALFLKKKFFA